MRLACLAQLVNVIAPIFTATGGGIVKQTIFFPFQHASRYGRGVALGLNVQSTTYDDRDFGPVPHLEAVGVFDEEKGELTIFAVNRDLENELHLEADLRDFTDYRSQEHIALTHADLKACNSLDKPRAVEPQWVANSPNLSSARIQATLRAASWNVIRLVRN